MFYNAKTEITKMKTYYTTGFKGHYPVGTSAIVIAENEVEAKALLLETLSKYGLAEKNKDTEITFTQVHTRTKGAIILQDGDY